MYTCVCDGKNSCTVPGGLFATVVREDLESLLQRICSQLTTVRAVIQKQCLLIWKSARTQILKSYWSWSETASYDAIVPLMYQRASVFN